ncbi:helicase with zinc finger 2, transcriptional coactivator [Pontoporia blainvillei]|uniref:Helicase with zinc finger 2, transcriptional coactivator n=1 Tax=Pontoporia blainvillei TaxID=48723 RepID=A0ABX0RZE4_PONBL|nr:helicase with zinc finger 2, transcriptional coactivator [Pontoporia blainvillei]
MRQTARPPTIPRLMRPGLPLLQPGLGCRCHHNQRPFARSPEEAPVWTSDREHCGSRLGLKTLVRGIGARAVLPRLRATCGSREAFENRCSSLEHTQMLALDMTVPWKRRSLPAGLSTLELCLRPNLCEFGDVCAKAYSEQELQEWTQRTGTAVPREHTPWQAGPAEYQQSHSEVLVAPLLHVALLKRAPGADFSLVAPSPSLGQVFVLGKCFCTPGSPAQFRVGVRVQSSCFGTVQQWVVFHFCHWAVLLRKPELQLGQTALETPALGILFPQPGALYAQVPIPSLVPDTDEGFLLG